MKIDEINISGFKGIRNLAIHPKKINILVGRNNTGKTSILEAINRTFNVNVPEMEEEYDQHLSSLINVNEKESKIVVKLANNEIKYLRITKPEPKEILLEFKNRLFDRMKKHSPRTSPNVWERGEEILNGILSKKELLVEIEKRAVKIESGNKMLLVFSFSPIIIKELEPLMDYFAKNTHTPKSLVPLILTHQIFLRKDDGKTEKTVIFLKQLALEDFEISEMNKSQINNIQNYLKNRETLENLVRFDVDTLLFKIDDKEHEIPYSFMGDGFKSLIGLIAQTSEENKIILIEEPENHMHPAYIREVMRQIIDFSKTNDIQFFITTHNFDILDVVSLDVLEPDYQEYLDKELNIVRLETFGKDIVAHELNRQSAKEQSKDIQLDLRGL